MGTCKSISNCGNNPNHEGFSSNIGQFYSSTDSQHILSKILKNERDLFNKNEKSLDTFSIINSLTNTLNLAQYETEKIYYNEQRFDTIVKSLKKTNSIFIDESFSPVYKHELKFITKESDGTGYNDGNSINTLTDQQTALLLSAKLEKISDLFFLKSPIDIITCFQNDNFDLASYSASTQIKFNFLGNPNLFNCILFLSIKNKYYLKNILYQFDFSTKVYCIKLYHKCLPKLIVIDERILVNESYNPLFINANEKTFWLMLIEKAILKLTSHQFLINGFASDFFSVLTFIPVVKFSHETQSKTKIWERIKESLTKKYILFCESRQKISFSFFISGAFTVNKRKYIELILPEYNIFDVVNKTKICNIKKKIVIHSEDIKESKFFQETKLTSEKIIFMPFEFFYSYFDSIFSAIYNPGFFHTVKEIPLTSQNEIGRGKNVIMKLKSLQINHVFLSLTTSEKGTLSYPFRFIIAELVYGFNEEENEFSFKYVTSLYATDQKSLSYPIEINMESGLYFAFISYSKNIESEEDNPVLIVSIYSSTYIEIIDVSPKQKALYKNVDIKLFNNISKIYQSLFQSYVDLHGSTQLIEKENEIIYKHSISNENFGYSIVGVENTSNDKIVYLDIKYKVTGMILLNITKEEETNLISNLMVCPPKQKNIYVFEWVDKIEAVRIEIKPKFYIKQYFLGNLSLEYFESHHIEMQRHLIKENEDVFYSIIEGAFGIYLIVENEGNSVYTIGGKIGIEVDKDNKACSDISLKQVNPFTKEYVFLLCNGFFHINYMNGKVKMELYCKKL